LKNFQIGNKDVSTVMKLSRGFYWVICSEEATDLMHLLDTKRTGVEGFCCNWCKLWSLYFFILYKRIL